MRLLSALLLAASGLAACAPSPLESDAVPSARETSERGRVLGLLARADTAAFYQAYRALDGFAYTRYERTVQHVDGDAPHAQTHTERVEDGKVPPSAPRSAVQRAFAPGTSDAAFPRFVLPKDPAYLQPRHYHTYQYRPQPDTVLNGETARVVEIRVRPDVDAPPAVRRVRYYFTGAAHTLTAVTLDRADRGLWFTESSRYYLRVRSAGGTYVPDLARFATATAFPFGSPRRTERTLAYYAFDAR